MTFEHIKMTSRAEELYRELHARAVSEHVPCLDKPAQWVDYEEPPTPEEAEAMCFGCPLRELCGRFADESRATWGVYDGRVYDESSE